MTTSQAHVGAWFHHELPRLNRAVLYDGAPATMVADELAAVLPLLPSPGVLDPVDAQRLVIDLGLAGAAVARHHQEQDVRRKQHPETSFDGLYAGPEQLAFRAYFAALADRTGTGHYARDAYASLVIWNVPDTQVRFRGAPLATLPGVNPDGHIRSYTGDPGERWFFDLVKRGQTIELAANELLQPLSDGAVGLTSDEGRRRVRLATTLLEALRRLFVEFAATPVIASAADLVTEPAAPDTSPAAPAATEPATTGPAAPTATGPAAPTATGPAAPIAEDRPQSVARGMHPQYFMDVFRQFAVHWVAGDIPPSGALDVDALKRDFLLGTVEEHYVQHVDRIMPALLGAERADLTRLIGRPSLPDALLRSLGLDQAGLLALTARQHGALAAAHPALVDWYQLLAAHARAAGGHLMLSKRFLFNPQRRRDESGVGDRALVSNRRGTTGMDEHILDRLTRMRREHVLAVLRGSAVAAARAEIIQAADDVEVVTATGTGAARSGAAGPVRPRTARAGAAPGRPPAPVPVTTQRKQVAGE